MTAIQVVLVILGLAMIAGIVIYNGLVNRKNLMKEGWSGIDVQLKRRVDLIPNLVEAVKGYVGHESDVLEKVTHYRAEAMAANNPQERARAEGMLSHALGNLFAVVENYPHLKANENFLELQKTLVDIEDQIQLARRYYNGSARNLNIAIQLFPSNIVATIFHFEEAPYFELENPAEKTAPKAAFS